MTDYYAGVKTEIEKAFADCKVLNDMAVRTGNTTPQALQVEAVGIAGSPDPESLPGFKGRGDNDKNKDRFDVAVRVKDLIALNEPQTREAALGVLQKLFSKVAMPEGKTLADFYDFSVTPSKSEASSAIEELQKKETGQKICPLVTFDTSLNDKLESKNTVHILAALPEGISHTQVAAAIAAPTPAVSVASQEPTQTANAAEAAAVITPPPVTETVTEQAAPAPGFADKNPKAPLLTATPPADSKVEQLEKETPALAAGVAR